MNLANDERQLLTGESEHVDRDVKHIVRCELCDESPRHDVQILETLNHARDRAKVRVSDHVQTE